MSVLNKIIVDFDCDQCNTNHLIPYPDIYTHSDKEYGRDIITVECEFTCPDCGKRHCVELH